MPEPRLAPLPFAEWDETTRTTLLQFLRRPEVYLSGDPDAPPMPIVLEMFAHHLALSASWLPFTEMLAGPDAKLSAEHRELLILRVSWRTRSGYEWAQHSRMGADAGLEQRQIDAVPEGPAAAVWTPLERTLLTAVDEMIDAHGVSDTTWDDSRRPLRARRDLRAALPGRGLPLPGHGVEQHRPPVPDAGGARRRIRRRRRRGRPFVVGLRLIRPGTARPTTRRRAGDWRGRTRRSCDSPPSPVRSPRP